MQGRRKPMDTTARPKSIQPFLKWAGGKRQLIPSITRRLPAKVDCYYEPFVGGGAVFFSLAETDCFRRAVLSDQNVELIETYRAVRDDVEGVIRTLKTMPHSEAAYYRIRALKPRTAARRAARMIYLNRTGYNGLYRVNRAGQFNVPFGRYTRPNICDEQRLRRVSSVLRGVELQVADFADIVKRARPGDAVYFDPPYLPMSSTARFAEYHSSWFEDADHVRLAQVYADLTDRGIATVLSNSDTPRTREIFGGFKYELVRARRSINSNARHRGAVNELLVYGRS